MSAAWQLILDKAYRGKPVDDKSRLASVGVRPSVVDLVVLGWLIGPSQVPPPLSLAWIITDTAVLLLESNYRSMRAC